MKNYLAALLLFVCFGAQAQEKFYHLDIIASSKAAVKCYVNGFPVYDVAAMSNSMPIDLYLTGANNTLEVVVESDKDVTVDGDIALYKPGEMTGDGIKAGVAPFHLEGKSNKKTVTFSTNGHDFSTLLKDSPVITNEQQVKDYAAYLLKLVDKKDAKAIAAEMEPKFADYAKVYGETVEKIRTEFTTFFSNMFLKEAPAKAAQKVISITPCCGKRIYKLMLNKDALLKRGGYSIPVYVAMVNGKLKIVR